MIAVGLFSVPILLHSLSLIGFSGLYLCWLPFFKQKTAYDLSTRDWSSDVCSSDLWILIVGAGALLAVMLGSSSKVRENRTRSEERRVGKECRSRGSPYHYKNEDELLLWRGDRLSGARQRVPDVGRWAGG